MGNYFLCGLMIVVFVRLFAFLNNFGDPIRGLDSINSRV